MATDRAQATPQAIAPGEGKCLACGYANKPGDDACAACGSSLHLRLCAACEAINSMSAETCHACGTPFALPDRRSALPQRAADERTASGRRRQLAALIALPAAATLVLAIYVYRGAVGGAADHAAPDARKIKAAQAIPGRPSVPSATKPQVHEGAGGEPAAQRVKGSEIPRAAVKTPVGDSRDKAAPALVTHTMERTVEVAIPASAVRGHGEGQLRPVSEGERSYERCSDAAAALGFCRQE